MKKINSIVINGKYLSASPTGVHRVAHELASAYSELKDIQKQDEIGIKIISPRNNKTFYRYKNIKVLSRSFLTWQFWEQFELPFRCKGDLLVNLCNLGPVVYKPSVTMIHDAQVFISPKSYSFPFRLWYKSILPILGNRNEVILTVSEYSKLQLIAYGVASPEKIVVIYNGVDHMQSIVSDTSALEVFGLEQKSYVLALASTQDHKNIKILFSAFSDWKLAECKLVLFGSAKPKDFSKLQISIPPNVVFIGKVTDAQLKSLYESAICLAFPSTTEGFGLPPLEAMFLGCPAVVSPCGALPEVCGDAALYAKPDDEKSWVSQINILYRDKSVSAEYSARGRKRAGFFTWKKAASKLKNLLESRIKNGSHLGT